MNRDATQPLRPRALARLRDLVTLTKPRVTVLVAATALAGVVIEPRIGAAGWLAVLATTLLVGAANALNCWVERDVDGLMARTRSRPLPSGRLEPALALAWGVAISFIALAALFAVGSALDLALGAASLVLYVGVYTPLKRVTPLALYVGAIPGAMPPVLARVAVTGELDAWAVMLFAIVYVWQVPHFLAIAIARRDEYAQAGLLAVPVVHGDDVAALHARVSVVLLTLASAAPLARAQGGLVYGLGATLAAALMLLAAHRRARSKSPQAWAKGLFVASLAYLPLVLGALALDRTLR